MRHGTCPRSAQPSTRIASDNHNRGEISPRCSSRKRKASARTLDVYMDDSGSEDLEIMQCTGKSRKNPVACEDELSPPTHKNILDTRAARCEGLRPCPKPTREQFGLHFDDEQGTSDDKIDQDETQNGNDMEYNEAEGGKNEGDSEDDGDADGDDKVGEEQDGRRRYDLRNRADVRKLRPRQGMGTKAGRDVRKGGPGLHKRPRVTRTDDSDDSLLVDKDQGPTIPRGQGGSRSGTSSKGGAEIQPLQVDESVSFDDVGGLSEYINALKEMVFFPLLYSDFFADYHITPPRGVLLCGPPGTGKTLIVRALAGAVSKAGQKVSFYMQKGADVLSKWVGEAERQLKLLFDEAQRNQPSIIFFDEIDGLAPVRSSNQVQNHNSIVSTLLALMDGLDSRGQVILIGATNRIDAIDGALRRPGRFDREFKFPLPGCEARAEILGIHTRKWKLPPSKELKLELAASCVGYCGADLKALCTEAAICAFREKFPQVYTSDGKFAIDIDSVKVEKYHFVEAMSMTTPAAHRGAVVHSKPLSIVVSPCLQRHLIKAMDYILDIFPPLAVSSQLTKLSMLSSGSAIPLVCRPRLLLCGHEGSGLDHLGRAILHELEQFPLHSLGLLSLLSDPSAKTPEEALIHIFGEAKKTTPSILYLPHLSLWWETAHEQLRAVLVTLLEEFPSHLPILLLATSSVPLAEVDATASSIFSDLSVYQLGQPSTEERLLFFDRLIEAALSVSLMGITKSSDVSVSVPELSKAPKVASGPKVSELKGRVEQMNTEENPQLQDSIASKSSEEPEINDPNPEVPESFTAGGNQLEIYGEVSGHDQVIGSQDITMSDGEMTNQTESVRQLFVERTENYGIPQLETLYTRIMKSIMHKGNIDGSQPSILRYLLKFAEDAANF